jgi:hypothetical protein
LGAWLESLEQLLFVGDGRAWLLAGAAARTSAERPSIRSVRTRTPVGLGRLSGSARGDAIMVTDEGTLTLGG